MSNYDYTLYGLRIRSALKLPEINESKLVDGDTRGVVIEVGKNPSELPGGQRITTFMEVTSRDCLYRFEGVGSFLVEDGWRITVDADKKAAQNDVRAFLFGSAFGTLLHQRGLLPLHVSAVVSPKGVIAFTGPPGVGKSTTACLVHRETGWPILCDDVAVVRLIGGQPVLSTGLVRLKLWQDALTRFGISNEGLDRDLLRHEKFHLSSPKMFKKDGLPLKTLVTLEWGEDYSGDEIMGAEGFISVVNAVYRPYLVDLFSSRIEMNENCARIARLIDTKRVIRPKQGSYFPSASLENLFRVLPS